MYSSSMFMTYIILTLCTVGGIAGLILYIKAYAEYRKNLEDIMKEDDYLDFRW